MMQILVAGTVIVMFGLLLVQTAHKEWGKPKSWVSAVARTRTAVVNSLLSICVFWGGASLFIFGLAGSATESVNARVDFETGLVQALETASSRPKVLRETSVSTPDRWSFSLLKDDAGPVVRMDGIGHVFCARVLSDLSPHAKATLRAQVGTEGWALIDNPEVTCGTGARPVSLSLRPYDGVQSSSRT